MYSLERCLKVFFCPKRILNSCLVTLIEDVHEKTQDILSLQGRKVTSACFPDHKLCGFSRMLMVCLGSSMLHCHGNKDFFCCYWTRSKRWFLWRDYMGFGLVIKVFWILFWLLLWRNENVVRPVEEKQVNLGFWPCALKTSSHVF